MSSSSATPLWRVGVTCLYEQDVVALNSDGQQASVTVKNGAEQNGHHFDGLVVSAGVMSRRFAAQLGDRVNIYPVKGHSITVNLLDDASQAAAPMVSLLDDETKLVTSRLGADRFRVAGTAEFNGDNKDIRADRIQPLINWVNTCFPGMNTRQVVPWAGLRPMMPNVFYNTGHGHLGWTLSAVTADMVAEVVAGS